MTVIRRAFIFWAVASISACTILPEQEPQQVYRLPNHSSPESTEASPAHSLRIETPRADRTLSSARLLVMPHPNQLSVYEGARWNDQAPRVLRDHLIETFLRSETFPAVVPQTSRVETTAALVSDLRTFQSRYIDGSPEIVIRLDAYLIDRNRQRLLAARRFEVVEPTEAPDIDAVVEAFGRASDRLGEELVHWSLTHIPNADSL